ncbi:YajG family lipoprotein [Henriciella mobilis]|nr:hypothetical protein [Henriciella mobilis]
MKRQTVLALIASLLFTAACATDVLSTEPEVDIDPDKVGNPTYPPEEPE